MPKKFKDRNTVKLAKIAGLTLLLPGCLTNSPKAVIGDASVTESKIAGDAVTSAKIMNGSIQTVDLMDGAVTSAKLDPTGLAIANGTTSTWSGAVTMNGAVTLGDAAGDVITVTGTPTFAQTVTANGALTLLGNASLGNSASADAHTILGASTVTGSTTLSTAATEFPGLRVEMTGAPAVDTSADYFGTRSVLNMTNTLAINDTSASAWGSFSSVTHSPAALGYRQIAGVGGRILNSSAATVVNGIGVSSTVQTTGGIITNAYGFHAMRDISGGGTTTNYVGLFLQDPEDPTNAAATAFGTTLYGIFSDGANTKNFFEGNVGINVADPTFKLDVSGTVRLVGISAETNGTYICIEAGGEITSGGATCAASDRRLKKNILPVKGALDKLAGLNGVTFEWKDPAKGSARQIGLVAQDVLPQFPEAVEQNSKGFYHVNYDGLVGPLVEAVKELYGKWKGTDAAVRQQQIVIGQLERRIELENLALKSENKALKDRLEKIERALAQGLPGNDLKKDKKVARKQ